jgi:hypothetical protein
MDELEKQMIKVIQQTFKRLRDQAQEQQVQQTNQLEKANDGMQSLLFNLQHIKKAANDRLNSGDVRDTVGFNSRLARQLATLQEESN